MKAMSEGMGTKWRELGVVGECSLDNCMEQMSGMLAAIRERCDLPQEACLLVMGVFVIAA